MAKEFDSIEGFIALSVIGKAYDDMLQDGLTHPEALAMLMDGVFTEEELENVRASELFIRGSEAAPFISATYLTRSEEQRRQQDPRWDRLCSGADEVNGPQNSNTSFQRKSLTMPVNSASRKRSRIRGPVGLHTHRDLENPYLVNSPSPEEV